MDPTYVCCSQPALSVQVIEGLEETRTQLVMVTEAVFCSLGNLLTAFQGLPEKVHQPAP